MPQSQRKSIRKKNTPRTPAPVPSDGEVVDFDNVSDNGDEGSDPGMPGSTRTPAAVISAPQPEQVLPAKGFTGVAPMPALTDRTSRAQDIDYFFDRGNTKAGTRTVCKLCRAMQQEKPNLFPPSVKFDYSSSTSTSTLRKHLMKKHEKEFVEACVKFNWDVPQPQSDGNMGPISSAPLPGREPFSSEALLKHIINFIIADDQAINVVECPEFRQLLLLLREDLVEEDIPKRDKIRSAIIKAWHVYYKILKEELQSALGQVSYTSDTWSSGNRTPFYALTAHWIYRDEADDTIKLKARLIAFHRLRGRHTAENMARTTLDLLDRAETTTNSGHFTMDNLGTNDAMLDKLEEALDQREIPFDARQRRIICFPHTINIAVQCVLSKMRSTVTPESDDGFQSSGSDSDPVSADNRGHGQSFEAACGSDPIGRCRKIVIALRASGQRRDEFDNWVKTGNEKNWFRNSKGKAIKVPLKQLLRDVDTRWSSTYQMIKRFIEMRPAIDGFLKGPGADLEHLRLTNKEWEVLQEFAYILSFANNVQQVLSGEATPLLAGVIPVFEIFLTGWETLAKKRKHLAPFIKPGLDRATKYYSRMDRSDAYVVAMFINPSVRMSWIYNNWEPEWREQADRQIKLLMEKYRSKGADKDDNSSSPPTQESCVVVDAWQDFVADYEAALDDGKATFSRTPIQQTIEEEFSTYVMGAPASGNILDTLKFWQTHEQTFPTIFRMAMDFLPVQASAVPCERVFSSSSETDVKKRNRIHPELMEALQILKFALKKERLSFTHELLATEQDLIVDTADSDTDVLAHLLEMDQTALAAFLKTAMQD